MSYIGKPVSGLNLNPNAKGAVTVQQIIGDGTSYSYGLIKTPLSVNYIDVYINGVYQNKNEYSLAGSLLTFVQLVPLNYKIEVVITDAVVASDSGTIVINPTVSENGFMNKITITANHTVPVGYNMVSAGPITVANGIDVMVSSGSTWSTI